MNLGISIHDLNIFKISQFKISIDELKNEMNVKKMVLIRLFADLNIWFVE